MRNDSAAVVDITQEGRGGSITYRAAGHEIKFDWEFAMSPALALVWGPPRAQWTSRFPWAKDRQAAIFDFVGAEIVRQKSPGGGYEFDLDSGEMTILDANGERERRARSPR